MLWAYLLGGPFSMPPIDKYYHQEIAGFIVMAFTWVASLVPYEKW